MSACTLEKALRVLEACASARRALSLRELSEMTQESLSSVQRNVFTLEALGFLEREDDSRYLTLGRSCLRPAFGCLRENRFVELASPHLIDLAERLNARCDLTVLDGIDIVYFARFPSKDEPFQLSPVGRRWPAVNTASGRAILSMLPGEARDGVIKASRFDPITPHTITDREDILRQIEEARALGYACQVDEVLLGAASVASPVLAGDKGVLGAILVGGDSGLFRTEEQRAALGAVVRQTAAAINAYNI